MAQGVGKRGVFSTMFLGALGAICVMSGCSQDLDLGSVEREVPDLGAADVGQDVSEPDLDFDMAEAPRLRFLAGIDDIDVGWGHVCAVGDGELWCWGDNEFGQLGLGDGQDRFTATRVGIEANWDDVELGYYTSCATKLNGSLWCWGLNDDGQVGDGTLANRTVPTRVNFQGSVAELRSSDSHFCAVTSDARLYCWGDNRESQLGQGTNEQTGVVRIETPTEVTADGGIGWLAVAVGEGHTCGVRTDEVAMCWGRNTSGMAGGEGMELQVLEPRELSGPAGPARGWVGVQAGSVMTYLQDDQGVWYGIGTAESERIPGLDEDTFAPAPITLPAGVEPTSLGTFHGCGLDAVGALFCWGLNLDGLLADTMIGEVFEPTDVGSALGPVDRVIAGRFNTCAIVSGGAVYCRGENSSGTAGGGNPSGDAARWSAVGESF